MTSLNDFLESLLRTGEVLVGPGPSVPSPDAKSEALLRGAYANDGWHFPSEQPALDISIATKMATWMYAAAMCYADRSMDAESSAFLLQPPVVENTSVTAHYSVDLVLRHLPALYQIASGLADGDPVLLNMKRMAWLWPLSSVGISLTESWGSPDTAVLRGHPGLWRVYLDRIIAFGDGRRLSDDVTKSASRNSLGLHPDLALRLQPHWQDVEPFPIPMSSSTS